MAAWLDGPWSQTQVDHFVVRMTECWNHHGIAPGGSPTTAAP